MYIPKKYREEHPEHIRKFIQDNAFGILASSGSTVPFATHLPLELTGPDQNEWSLEGHFAKANPQWRHIEDGQPVLCIFNGPHAYVSSSWYRDEEVPTWNYQAVHIKGIYRKQRPDELLEALNRLVDKYESQSEHPISLKNLSSKTMRQVNGIVGFRIEKLEMEAVFKLSQGREADHPKIISELEKRGGQSEAVASAMKNRPNSR